MAGFSRIAVVLRIFCATALLSLAFGHQTAQAGAPPEAFSESYRLPDGTFADICAEGRHGPRNPALKPRCEVCLLAASVILPPPGDDAWLTHGHASLDSPLRQVSFVTGTTTTGRPKCRAPPTLA